MATVAVGKTVYQCSSSTRRGFTENHIARDEPISGTTEGQPTAPTPCVSIKPPAREVLVSTRPRAYISRSLRGPAMHPQRRERRRRRCTPGRNPSRLRCPTWRSSRKRTVTGDCWRASCSPDICSSRNLSPFPYPDLALQARKGRIARQRKKKT